VAEELRELADVLQDQVGVVAARVGGGRRRQSGAAEGGVLDSGLDLRDRVVRLYGQGVEEPVGIDFQPVHQGHERSGSRVGADGGGEPALNGLRVGVGFGEQSEHMVLQPVDAVLDVRPESAEEAADGVHRARHVVDHVRHQAVQAVADVDDQVDRPLLHVRRPGGGHEVASSCRVSDGIRGTAGDEDIDSAPTPTALWRGSPVRRTL
jgi:hypothetical protein